MMRRHGLAGVLALLFAGGAVGQAGLVVQGEVVALDAIAIGPPSVRGQWQFQIVNLAQDGSRVEAGDLVVEFDAGELQRKLVDANNKHNEKSREREKLLLELAERERNQALELADERAKLEKARRKAAQPAETMASVEYRKLVLQRDQAERRMVLAETRMQRAAEQRRAELALVESELNQAEAESKMLVAAIAAMRVTAPRAGIVQVKSGWRGERFETGSQIWMAQTVVELPDPENLSVRAMLPERELSRVRVDQPVRVLLDGGASPALPGRIVSLGRVIRSKSRLQPIPVLDVLVRLEGIPADIKPGQSVRVEIGP